MTKEEIEAVKADFVAREQSAKEELDTATKQVNLGLSAFAIIFFSFGVWRWYTTPNYQSPAENVWLVQQSAPAGR